MRVFQHFSSSLLVAAAVSVGSLCLASSLGLGIDVAQAQESETPKDSAAAGKGEPMTVAILETSMGSITCRLLPDVAPKAVENFVGLAKRGYYEGVVFHRVITDFMIQGGDPTGTGYGGKSIWEIPFEDEVSPEWRFDRPGILAMANTGRPRSNGSQFFVTLKETPWLNDRHTIFGEVIDGYDVVQAIGAVETGAQDKPIEEVKIESVTIEERPAE